jgi:dihydroorotate dehydrogenase
MGSAIRYGGMAVFGSVCEELKDYMRRYGHANLESLRGTALIESWL